MTAFHARNLKGISRTVIAVVILVVIIAAIAGYLVITQQRAPAAVPTTPAQKFKIAIVSDIGGRGDLSFNDMAFKGGDDAKRDFGIGVVELVSKTEQDYIPNLRTAAQDPDVKLIVGVGFLLTEALVTVALEFPNKFFAGIDTSSQEIVKEKYKDKYPLPNLLDIRFEEHKGSALVGALACLAAAAYNYPYVGMVLGIEIPVLWKFEAGYKWGCNWALEWYKSKFGRDPPGIGATPVKSRVLWTYTGTFSDVIKGYTASKPMYEKGAIAVYNVAGPLGLGINQAVEEIARARNLTMGPPFWIGVDANQDWINPGFVIASMMKRVDKGVYIATKLVLENKFTEVVKRNNGVLVLGIGTKIDGELAEGISVSTLQDLDEFIQMGINAERLTGKKVLPAPPEEIKAKVKAMRDSIPSWVWEGVKELEDKIRRGEVSVPLPLTPDDIKKIRDMYG
ncbi:MAG: BMP family ABC transporter substrate-binding protein [Sulfolobales archaeon]|jgi:basic membrane protein A